MWKTRQKQIYIIFFNLKKKNTIYLVNNVILCRTIKIKKVINLKRNEFANYVRRKVFKIKIQI